MRQIKIDIPSEDPQEVANVLADIAHWQFASGISYEAAGKLKNGKEYYARWVDVPELKPNLPGNLGQLLGGLKVLVSPWIPDDSVVVSAAVGEQMKAIAVKDSECNT